MYHHGPEIATFLQTARKIHNRADSCPIQTDLGIEAGRPCRYLSAATCRRQWIFITILG